jgi:hypothetical protein
MHAGRFRAVSRRCEGGRQSHASRKRRHVEPMARSSSTRVCPGSASRRGGSCGTGGNIGAAGGSGWCRDDGKCPLGRAVWQRFLRGRCPLPVEAGWEGAARLSTGCANAGGCPSRPYRARVVLGRVSRDPARVVGQVADPTAPFGVGGAAAEVDDFAAVLGAGCVVSAATSRQCPSLFLGGPFGGQLV